MVILGNLNKNVLRNSKFGQNQTAVYGSLLGGVTAIILLTATCRSSTIQRDNIVLFPWQQWLCKHWMRLVSTYLTCYLIWSIWMSNFQVRLLPALPSESTAQVSCHHAATLRSTKQQDDSVWLGIVTRLLAGRPRNLILIPGKNSEVFSFKTCRQALGPTQPINHWELGTPSLWVKWPGKDAWWLKLV
jgi:hypothetical protein